MKKVKLIFSVVAIVMALSAFNVLKKQGEPWTKNQLMEPSVLAKEIKEGGDKTLIFSIGPSGLIKGSVEIGAVQEKENLEKFKRMLLNTPKEKSIVIYCGCCPFENCPNIRPAFELLKELKFTNHTLLNLPNNLKVDWIDKGYPMN